MSPQPTKQGPCSLPIDLGDDFTVIIRFEKTPVSDCKAEIQKLLREVAPDAPEWKEGSVSFDDPRGGTVRIQPASCFAGRAVSLTVRAKPPDPQPKGYRNWEFDVKVPKGLKKDSPLHTQYAPKSTRRGNEKEQDLCSVEAYCNAIDAVVLENSTPKEGFLIIAGATGTLKTDLATGLIHGMLQREMQKWWGSPKSRRPHLVTCEDDIEKMLVRLVELKKIKDRDLYLWDPRLPDYTPRRKGDDFDRVSDAVDDALRMKPTIFYAGEIREKEDWSPLFRLAKSHLVVLTTHASSLIGTFALIESHLDIKHESQRSELVSSIAGVVHMRGGKLTSSGKGMRYLLPAAWKGDLKSRAAYTSAGLSSIMPDSGRRTFADKFLALREGLPDDAPRELRKTATQWDLCGE